MMDCLPYKKFSHIKILVTNLRAYKLQIFKSKTPKLLEVCKVKGNFIYFYFMLKTHNCETNQSVYSQENNL